MVLVLVLILIQQRDEQKTKKNKKRKMKTGERERFIIATGLHSKDNQDMPLVLKEHDKHGQSNQRTNTGGCFLPLNSNLHVVPGS